MNIYIKESELLVFGAIKDLLSMSLYQHIYTEHVLHDEKSDGDVQIKLLYMIRAAQSDRVLVHRVAEETRPQLWYMPAPVKAKVPLYDMVLLGAKSTLLDAFDVHNEHETQIMATKSRPDTFGAFYHNDTPYILTYVFVDDKMLDEIALSDGYEVVNVADLSKDSLNTSLDGVLLDNYIGTEEFNNE